MKKEIYNLEVGVLLDKNHEEYDCYNMVYSDNYGFYDENVIAYIKEDYDKAIEYANDYVKNGVNKTYAILTYQGLLDIENDKELECIVEHGYSDFLNLDYSSENVVYSIVKDDKGNIIQDFINKGVK